MARSLREIETRVLFLRSARQTFPQIAREIGRTPIAARELYRKAIRKLRQPAYQSDLSKICLDLSAAVSYDIFPTMPFKSGR